MRDTCTGTTISMDASYTISARFTTTTTATRRATLVIADTTISSPQSAPPRRDA
jgi:hypothetical protein